MLAGIRGGLPDTPPAPTKGLGEVQGLQVSLDAASAKLVNLGQMREPVSSTTVDLGIPTITDSTSAGPSRPSPHVIRLRVPGRNVMRLILVMATALVALAGCSTATTSTPVAAPTTTTTSTAPTTTTPAPLSKADAARRYLAIVRPYNVALEQLEQAINSGQPVATLRTRTSELAAANETQIKQLQAAVWPTDVRAPMDELIAESGKAQPFFLQAAQAKTRNQVVQAVLDSRKHDAKAPAKSIRELLELAKYDEGDYGGS